MISVFYMISKNNEINKVIDKWNKSDFESMRIHVSVPISLCYIQFNLDQLYFTILPKTLSLKTFLAIRLFCFIHL